MKVPILAAAALACPLLVLAQADGDKPTGGDQDKDRSEVHVQVQGGPNGSANGYAFGDGQSLFLGPGAWTGFGDDQGAVLKSVDLDNSDVGAALKALFMQAGRDYVVDGELPKDARVTLKASNVRLSTALDMLTQSAGMGWRTEYKDGKLRYRVGKNVRSGWQALLGHLRDGQGRIAVDQAKIAADQARMAEEIAKRVRTHVDTDWPMVYSLTRAEQRSTFTCPHCKGQVTVLRKSEQPRCPKCGRVFQGDWQFCPADGSKRPATTGTWRYCPLCGKQVEPQ